MPDYQINVQPHQINLPHGAPCMLSPDHQISIPHQEYPYHSEQSPCCYLAGVPFSDMRVPRLTLTEAKWQPAALVCISV